MILFTLIFLTICGYAFSITIHDCPNGVARDYYLQVYGNSCFEFVTFLQRDSYDAEDYCQENNGHLVSIESEEVNNWISEQLRDVYSNDENVWIGFNDRDSENNHEWLDGSEISYHNWAPQNGPRSSFQPLQYAIDCAVLNSDNNYWYDQQCEEGIFNLWGLAGDYSRPFVCRYKVDVPGETSPDEDSQDKEESPSESEGENEPSEAGDKNVDGSETETENDKEQSETEPHEAADIEQNPKVDSEGEVKNGTTAEDETGKPEEQSAGKGDTPKLPTESTEKEGETQPEDGKSGGRDQNETGEGGETVGDDATETQKETDDMIRADLDNFFNECGEISCDKACGMSGLKKDDKGCFLCECDD